MNKSRYPDLDILVHDFEEGDIDLEEYISEYNKIIKAESKKQKDRDAGDKESS